MIKENSKPQRGRPRIHPDRKAYQADWIRNKRAKFKEGLVFSELTDNLFGYLAQIGLRRTSSEFELEDGDIDYKQQYNAVINLARKAHEECESIRSRILSEVAK